MTHKNNQNGQTRFDVNYSQQPPNIKATNPKMVVLLESPHIEEFNAGQYANGTAPAWGNTGKNFDDWFIKVLNLNINNVLNSFLPNNNQDIDVYLVNAIQYQCSLGKLNGNRGSGRRDAVFFNLWNKQPDSFLQDLADRLNFINPNVIINACTKNLQRFCCNGNSIAPLLNRPIPFLAANHHMSVWGKSTFLL